MEGLLILFDKEAFDSFSIDKFVLDLNTPHFWRQQWKPWVGLDVQIGT